VWPDLKFGSIFHHAACPLEGGVAPKLIVVLGIRPEDGIALVALTTSQPPPDKITPGCHGRRGLFLCQKQKRDCFEVDTYIQLYRLGILTPKICHEWREHTKLIGALSLETTHAIKNCAAQTEDISPRHKALLGQGAPKPEKKKP